MSPGPPPKPQQLPANVLRFLKKHCRWQQLWEFPQSAPFPILSQEKPRVSELCSISICIIHFDGKILALHLCSLWYLKITKGLFPAPCRLPEGDYQRKGEGFQVRTLRLCYRLVPGEAALGGSARGKLPSTKCRVRGREASRLGWHSRIPKLLTFGGIWKDEGWASKILLWWLPTY